MSNFGMHRLFLVDPKASPGDYEAARMATHGLAILKNAICVRELEEALVDCRVVLATSAKGQGLYRRQSQGQPETMLTRLIAALPNGPCALVFGPEPTGLSNEEIAICHGMIRIPTGPLEPSLNLAQAVAICLYELHRHALQVCGSVPAEVRAIAPFEDQERMFTHLREGLTAIHFLFGQRADVLMHALKQLITRALPSPGEVQILHGLARQLLYLARVGNQQSPLKDDPIGSSPPDDSP